MRFMLAARLIKNTIDIFSALDPKINRIYIPIRSHAASSKFVFLKPLWLLNSIPSFSSFYCYYFDFGRANVNLGGSPYYRSMAQNRPGFATIPCQSRLNFQGARKLDSL